MSVKPVASATILNAAPIQPEASSTTKVTQYVKGDFFPVHVEAKTPSRDDFSFQPLPTLEEVDETVFQQPVRSSAQKSAPSHFKKTSRDALRRAAMHNLSKDPR